MIYANLSQLGPIVHPDKKEPAFSQVQSLQKIARAIDLLVELKSCTSAGGGADMVDDKRTTRIGDFSTRIRNIRYVDAWDR